VCKEGTEITAANKEKGLKSMQERRKKKRNGTKKEESKVT
jgi:hypothetical protein